ncbi:hypothetical protein [Amycolatopsis sp. 195334CR]|uniref:hypothetical protein n=1 Tax=Amycolatopsis sp. 195334CR TaxID=2814588 RepID=UPI001A8D5342|nr:hypothetical protein [Amycolatopsis sp. 195334CR]MBN6034052.1 hypothetical protein [Amycolatopsis sp. 195334CR]
MSTVMGHYGAARIGLPRSRAVIQTLNQLTGLGQDGLARLRGLLLIRLLQAGRENRDDGLLRLLLLPPEPDDTRFALYEIAQALDGNAPVPEAIEGAVAALDAASGDPCHLPEGDRRWAGGDPQARGLYRGTGLRADSPHPAVHGTTIARLVDGTAPFLTIGVADQPLIAQASEPYRLSNDTRPADDVEAVADPPFQIVDALTQYLR